MFNSWECFKDTVAILATISLYDDQGFCFQGVQVPRPISIRSLWLFPRLPWPHLHTSGAFSWSLASWPWAHCSDQADGQIQTKRCTVRTRRCERCESRPRRSRHRRHRMHRALRYDECTRCCDSHVHCVGRPPILKCCRKDSFKMLVNLVFQVSDIILSGKMSCLTCFNFHKCFEGGFKFKPNEQTSGEFSAQYRKQQETQSWLTKSR